MVITRRHKRIQLTQSKLSQGDALHSVDSLADLL